ncbi:MAG: response regulator [Candidatus Omnitrophota bacterium]
MKKIVVIDDEPKIRNLFCRTLHETGYEALEAEDGKEGLRLLKEDKNIGLVILDIRLPKINGLAIFDAIKTYSPQVKVIISSVYSHDEQEFLIGGADDYYYKSDSILDLIDKVYNCINE